LPEAGASRSGRKPGASSLDTSNHLATSERVTSRDWLDSLKTERDTYREQELIHRQLVSTVHTIWQSWAAKAHAEGTDEVERAWWGAYELALCPLRDESEVDRWHRVEKWLKENKPTGTNAEALKWEKKWTRLRRCQTEWIGYRAACCGERSATIAVPVGCNDRLCPLCAWHRSQLARVRVKSMFDRLTHPILITLTVPNKKSIRKHDFKLFRQRVKQFLAEYKGYIQGGVYSMETTYNRSEKTWHIHAHVLADACASLPCAAQKLVLADRYGYAFLAIKLRMEFDWLRLWTNRFGKALPKNADPMEIDGDRYEFERWVRAGRSHVVKEWDFRLKKLIPLALSPEEFTARTSWNKANRRLVDVRPVRDREGAAREVLKYITKAADFSDIPDAVEQFSNATRGARLVQTFGSWYGAKFDTDFDPNHLDDWGEMKCTCGLNMWERMGVFYRRDVEMEASGRWHVKASLGHQCRGTVPRPTIRALQTPEETEESLCLK
jgi:hypothetical protein